MSGISGETILFCSFLSIFSLPPAPPPTFLASFCNTGFKVVNKQQRKADPHSETTKKTDLILIIFRDITMEVNSLPYSSGFVVPL